MFASYELQITKINSVQQILHNT